jgi:hypothetical protein
MLNSRRDMVDNPITRYDVSDRSGLVPGADGSVDATSQNTAPAGDFVWMLRAYQTGPAVLAASVTYHLSSRCSDVGDEEQGQGR